MVINGYFYGLIIPFLWSDLLTKENGYFAPTQRLNLNLLVALPKKLVSFTSTVNRHTSRSVARGSTAEGGASARRQWIDDASTKSYWCLVGTEGMIHND